MIRNADGTPFLVYPSENRPEGWTQSGAQLLHGRRPRTRPTSEGTSAQNCAHVEGASAENQADVFNRSESGLVDHPGSQGVDAQRESALSIPTGWNPSRSTVSAEVTTRPMAGHVHRKFDAHPTHRKPDASASANLRPLTTTAEVRALLTAKVRAAWGGITNMVTPRPLRSSQRLERGSEP